MTSTEDLFYRYEALLSDDAMACSSMAFRRSLYGPSYPGAELDRDLNELRAYRKELWSEIHEVHDELVTQEGAPFLELAVCLFKGGLGYRQSCDAAHLILGPA